MIFDKDSKTIHWGKDTTLTIGAGKLDDIYMQKNEAGPLSYTIYKS